MKRFNRGDLENPIGITLFQITVRSRPEQAGGRDASRSEHLRRPDRCSDLLGVDGRLYRVVHG